MIRFFDKKARFASRLAHISLVACDLDGTLLNDKNEVTPTTRNAIEALHESGVEMVLASGRSMAFTERYASIIGTDMPVIALNGGLISRIIHGEAPYVHAIPAGVLDIVAEVGSETETPLAYSLFTPGGLFATSEEAVLPKYLRTDGEKCTYRTDLRELEPETALVVVYGAYVQIQSLSVRLAQKYGRNIRRVQFSSQSQPDLCYLEIMHASANKGTALAHICKKLNISRSAVAAIGDFANDVEMLRYASVAAVMANAIEELHREADYITTCTNNEGGVAEFLETILREKRKR